MNKKKVMWSLVSLLIAILTVYTVITQSGRFSLGMFWDFIQRAHKGWLIAAFVCAFGFVWFEGLALIRTVKAFGFSMKFRKATVYGAADVYFSSITPSASGGQPAAAYFMMKDGISGTATTVALLLNLVFYTLALLVVGILAMLFRIDVFLGFDTLSQLLILIGGIVLIALAVSYMMLIRNAHILYGLCGGFFKIMEKLHLMHNSEKRMEKLNATMHDFKTCAMTVGKQPALLLELFFWNLMQRLSQLGVSCMVLKSIGYPMARAIQGGIIQCFVAMGSNCVPIPGGMGVADYIMLDGFDKFAGTEGAAALELMCRGITFYGASVISGLIILIVYLVRKYRKC